MKVLYMDGGGLKIIPETPFEESYMYKQGVLSALTYDEHNGLEARYIDDDLHESSRGKTIIYVTASPNKYGAKKEKDGTK